MEKTTAAAIRIGTEIFSAESHYGARKLVQEFELGDDGFLTSLGRFVSREEAADIAFKAGQTNVNKRRLQSYHVF